MRRRADVGPRSWSRLCRNERLSAQQWGRVLAQAADPLHLAGCMLFWAEGSRDRNSVIFTNADVEMHRTFITFLRRSYGIPDGRFRLTINCFLGNGLSQREIEAWWLGELGLARANLRPTVVNRPPRSSRARHRVLPYGTARLVVHSTALVQSIHGAIQEYAGFEREAWLDLAT